MAIRRERTPAIGERLKAFRTREGLSLRKVGECIDISHVALFDIEKGDHDPSALTIIKLCRLYRVSADVILGLKEESTS